jgi:predicted transposase/invertase (TIGR01784 family)
MAQKRTYISFDWALKKLLRQKANYGILEGFLSVLLKEDVIIKSITDPEANKEESILKINRIDIMVEDTKQRLMMIELQYNREIDYFYRMLFATSKASIEHIKEGYDYSQIKKVYSINLLYFELGQGEDYVYHGKNEFKGIHLGDTLQLSNAQKEKFLYEEVHEIYPEYYVIKINSFNDVAKDSLDEWIYFFKHSEVPENYTAKGLKEVEEKMRIEQLSPADKLAYQRHQLSLISERNVVNTARKEGQDIGFEQGEAIGLEKGEAIGLEKGEAIGLEKGEAIGIELTLKIIRLYNEKHAIKEIAKMVEKTEAFIKKVLEDAGLGQSN